MAKNERLNEEAARNNNQPTNMKLSDELQDRRIEKEVNSKRIPRS